MRIRSKENDKRNTSLFPSIETPTTAVRIRIKAKTCLKVVASLRKRKESTSIKIGTALKNIITLLTSSKEIALKYNASALTFNIPVRRTMKYLLHPIRDIYSQSKILFPSVCPRLRKK